MALSLGFIHAQESGESSGELRPRAPISLQAPDKSYWRVTTTYKQGRGDSPESKSGTEVALVRKVGKVLEEELNSGGTRYLSYIVGTLRVTDGATKDRISVVSPINALFPTYGDVDFDRLRWVSMENFTGVGDYEGRKVFVFKVTGDKKQLNPSQRHYLEEAIKHGRPRPPFASDSVAMLDVKTQLPVFYADEEVDQKFEFLSPPSKPLEIPERFQETLLAQLQYLQDLKNRGSQAEK